MKYTEQAVETLDDAGSVIANKNIEIEQLRQRVAELEGLIDLDVFSLAESNDLLRKRVAELESQLRVKEATIGKMANDAQNLTAELDALKQQRDELVKALERSLESFEYIAKYGNSCGHSQLRIPDLKAAIASVKEKQK